MNFFKDSQTFIDNLQCESQERVHELIKDLELSVTQSELVLRNIGRLCPPCSWPARDAKSHHQQKGRVLERPGPSSQFLYVDCNQGNGTRSESQISVFQLKNVLSVWCSNCFTLLVRANGPSRDVKAGKCLFLLQKCHLAIPDKYLKNC